MDKLVTTVPLELTLSQRAELAAIGLSELASADIKAADGKATETQRKLMLAQAVIIELLDELGLEPGPHCAELLSYCH